MNQKRPNPEELLLRAAEEALQATRGKLKIYLGAAPGVGKTYAMLDDAQKKRASGLDVVIGIVETHHRKEIAALMTSIEILPLKEIQYRNQKYLEFDLDAALKRHPGLILVDEMAHTNIPGSRHTKRWQDIKELLDLGIDVYTTINVQHIESLNDIVAQIIGTVIRETVPDLMLEMADSIELVDLPPDELLKRLHEGKVYFPKQAELAAEHFFRKGNLIALRELALRVTAAYVNAQVLSYRHDQAIQKTWMTTERLLVCVSPRPESARLIRAARRMAARLQATWFAIHVEAPGLRLATPQRQSAMQNLRLAEQLGAETHTLSGTSIVEEIINFARTKNITKVIIGKHIRQWWKELFSPSIVNKLMRNTEGMDIYIIHASQEEIKFPYPRWTRPHASWFTYGLSTAVVGVCTLINFFLFSYKGLGGNLMIVVYLLGVVAVSAYWNQQRGPSLWASLLSVFAFAFFFLPPLSSSTLSNPHYLITLIVMLLAAQAVSNLAIVSRQQAESYRLNERRTTALYALNRQLASHRGAEQLLNIAVQHIGEIFDAQVLALLPSPTKHLSVYAGFPEIWTLNPKERSIAQWVCDLEQPAGMGTETLPDTDAIYVPLRGSKGKGGVLRVKPKDPQRLTTPDQMHLLETFANQLALALEIDRLHENEKKTQNQMETEQLLDTLLSSISQDLFAPLKTIIRCSKTLLKTSPKPSITDQIAQNIYDEAQKMEPLVNNLHQIIYFESGPLTLHKHLHSLEEIISTALDRLEKKLRQKPVKIQLPEDLPLTLLDKALMEQVFINLIENAIQFTPPKSPIEISAQVKNKKIVVKVADHGPGLDPRTVQKIFDKFYRGQMPAMGIGIGLAICKSIVLAHGGTIWAENIPKGGAAFFFTLPLKKPIKRRRGLRGSDSFSTPPC